MADELSQFSDYDSVSYDFSMPEKKSSGTMDAAMGMSAASGLITGALGMIAMSDDIDRANEALMINMESNTESLLWNQQIRGQQLEDMAAVASDNMSMIGFEQMVAESTAKAKAAEGGQDPEIAIQQSMVNENFRKAQVQKEYRTSASSLLLQGTAELMSFENQQESMLSNQLDPMNAAMKVASTGMSSSSSGMRLFF